MPAPLPQFEQGVIRTLELLRPKDVLPPGADQDAREIRITELTNKQIALDHRTEEIKKAIEDPENGSLVASLTVSWRQLHAERTQVLKELETLKWESRTGQGESLAEVQTLLGFMAEKRGEELTDLRRRMKAAIRWFVESIWVATQPVGKRTAIAHVQIYLRNGTRHYLQILPVNNRTGKPRTGLRPWNLRGQDFRAGDIGGITLDTEPTAQRNS